MNLGQGKIVLALEGGYNLDSIATSTLACAELLVDGRTMNNSSETCPFESTWRVIQAVSSLFHCFCFTSTINNTINILSIKTS